MATAAFPIEMNHRETLGGGLVASLVMHALIFVFAVAWTMIGFRGGSHWGSTINVGSATHVKAVSALPGVPLPTPALTTQNTLVTESQGLHQPQPHTPPPPEPKAEEIQKFKDTVKAQKPLRINKRIQKQVQPEAANAIPTGAGGRPAMNYGYNVAASGNQFTFGDQAFGFRYGWYVEAVKTRISTNWLSSMLNPSVTRGRRAYVQFDIMRDGTIAHVKLSGSSGDPEADRSAIRAVEASNPLAPLPSDYRGSSISVNVSFDLSSH